MLPMLLSATVADESNAAMRENDNKRDIAELSQAKDGEQQIEDFGFDDEEETEEGRPKKARAPKSEPRKAAEAAIDKAQIAAKSAGSKPPRGSQPSRG